MRWQSLALIMVTGCPIAEAAKPAEPSPQDVIRVRRIEVVDAKGHARMTLSTDDTGSPVLALTDEAGRSRAVLSIVPATLPGGGTDGNPGLMLAGADGRGRALLFIATNNSPALMLTDAAGGTQSLTTAANFSLLDGQAKPLATLSNGPDGSALVLNDREHRERARAFVDDNGMAGLVVSDRLGTARAATLVKGTGVPSHILSDANGRARAALILSEGTTPTLGLFGEGGKSRKIVAD